MVDSKCISLSAVLLLAACGQGVREPELTPEQHYAELVRCSLAVDGYSVFQGSHDVYVVALGEHKSELVTELMALGRSLSKTDEQIHADIAWTEEYEQRFIDPNGPTYASEGLPDLSAYGQTEVDHCRLNEIHD